MFKRIIDSLQRSLKSLFGNMVALGALTGSFVTMLLALYPTLTFSVARVWQVLFILVMFCLSVVLFFLIQAMGLLYVDEPTGASQFLKSAGSKFWKLLVVSLPFLVLLSLAVWGTGKIDSTITAGMREAANSAGGYDKVLAVEKQIDRIHLVVKYVNLTLVCLVLPLFLIQLWNRIVTIGGRNTLRNLGSTILASYRPSAVITYLLGSVIFFVVPYFLISMKIPIKAPWAELFALGVRLSIAILIAYFGWIVTVGAIRLQDRQTSGTGNV